jgi:hypothetical protein
MSAAINNEVELDNARLALNASTRIIEALQADTRMKAVAAASGRQLSQGGWAMIEDKRDFIIDAEQNHTSEAA